MKSHVYVCMLMIFFGLSLGCFIPITLKSPDFNPLSVSTSSLKDSIIKGSQLGYTSSPPISITANSDFQSYASQGNGTKISPYVIQGLNITNTSTADNLIDITNTDAYFQIKNCFLKGGNRGISLEGVTNGEIANNFISNNTQSAIAVLFSSDNNTISSNTIINTEDGISISSCENNLINNNTVINTDGVGIHIYSNSQNNTLSNNYAQDNILDGIRLTSSSKNKLINNTLDDNYGAGINLFSSSDHNILLNNTALNNNGRGIYIYNSDNNTLLYNEIYDNSNDGISVQSSSKNTVVYNTVAYNTLYGIELYSSNNNTVKWNDVIHNYDPYNAQAHGASSQAYDYGSNNVFAYNYWDEWISPDTNNDNIVDLAYSIDGGGENNTDEFPVTSRNNPQMVIISVPYLIFPNGGETLKGTVTINWEDTDPLKIFNVTYALYYSFGDLGSWFLIQKGITNTSYDWDTRTAVSSVGNETHYLMRVIATSSSGISVEAISDGTFIIDRSTSTTTTSPSITDTSSNTTPSLTVSGGTIGLFFLGSFILIVTRRYRIGRRHAK